MVPETPTGHTGGDDHQITLFYQRCLLSGLNSKLHQFVCTGGTEAWSAAPHPSTEPSAVVPEGPSTGLPQWFQGRKRLTRRAVVPLLLTVRIASAPMSMAVVHAAWAVAAAIESRPWFAMLRIRLA